MLFHMNTMKYLCLNMESTEQPSLELVEFPNQYCFFKFMPCLQLQLMRNDNFVYEEELFYICCAETINGKNPYLMVDYREADFKDDEDDE